VDFFSASLYDECGLDSSTHGETGRALCHCVVGFTRRGATESECEVCVTGKYKEDFHHTDCSECQLCQVDEEVTRECNSSHLIACAPCTKIRLEPGATARSFWGVRLRCGLRV